MSRFDQRPPVPVSIGPCDCPGTPHGDGDFVYLAPVLSAPGGMAAQAAINEGISDSIRLQELLWRVYRDHGIVSWNLLDEGGEPVPVTPENVEAALPYGKGGRVVADAADGLYSEDMLVPFLDLMRQLGALSKDGSTSPKPATSATPTSTSTRRKRSSTPATAAVPPSE
jgi:hypothetical protein